jgi:hypothetical protein
MVATQRTFQPPSTKLVAAGTTLMVLGIVIGLVVSYALVFGSRVQVPSGGGAPAAAADQRAAALAQYQQTASNLAAAVERHDWQSITRFQSQLNAQMNAVAIQAIYAERSRLRGNLAAAEERHDVRMALAFRQQIADLCPAIAVSNAPAFCQ